MNRAESNRLIAEFMGGKIDDTFIYFDKTNNKFEDDTLHVSDLLFDSDWNWLMEVVEKIESIVLEEVNDTSFNVTIGATRYCVIQDNNGGMLKVIGEGKTKIESTYKAVVEFIKWYNQTN